MHTQWAHFCQASDVLTDWRLRTLVGWWAEATGGNIVYSFFYVVFGEIDLLWFSSLTSFEIFDSEDTEEYLVYHPDTDTYAQLGQIE